MTVRLPLISPEMIRRRPLLVLDLVDPVTGRSASRAVEARIESLPAPGRTRTGQFVWFDRDEPKARSVKVQAAARGNEFAGFEEVFNLPAWQSGAGSPQQTRELTPTGLYVPPAGRLAVGGMLIDNANDRNPIVDAGVALVVHSTIQSVPIESDLEAVTDTRGGFVSVMRGQGDFVPLAAPRPAPDACTQGWLRFRRGNLFRYSPLLTIGLGKLTRLPSPFVWAALASQAP